MKRRIFKVARNEPLLHFLIFGTLIFCLDVILTVDRKDPKNIIVDDARVNELMQIFQEGQGREPTTEEVERMMVQWTQNEIFYREGLSMGLDAGDEMIRSRLILKMRNVLFNNTLVEPPNENELQEYFELNRGAYDTPERFDFEQVFLMGVRDDKSAKNAKSLNEEIIKEKYGSSLRTYARRPRSNISALFGTAQTQTLVSTPLNQWVSIKSDMGWHLARITQRYPKEPAILEEARAAVTRDWQKLSNDYQLAQATQKLAKKYQLHLELSDALENKLNLSASQDVNKVINPVRQATEKSVTKNIINVGQP